MLLPESVMPFRVFSFLILVALTTVPWYLLHTRPGPEPGTAVPESEAMGMALNLRPSITEFLPVAKLALPLLETFCGGGR